MTRKLDSDKNNGSNKKRTAFMETKNGSYKHLTK